MSDRTAEGIIKSSRLNPGWNDMYYDPSGCRIGAGANLPDSCIIVKTSITVLTMLTGTVYFKPVFKALFF